MVLDNHPFIYLDNAATTKVNEEVLKIYNDISLNHFANASSIHNYGVESDRLINKAREDIKRLLNIPNHHIIFTSGATEANNLFIKGIAFKYKNRGKHIIISAIEHPSVSEAAKQLQEEFGFMVTTIPVDHNGVINLDELIKCIRDDTILISIMAVNNEIGSINNIDKIIEIKNKYPKIFLHVDATQAVGKIKLNYKNIDAFTYSNHKIHGLKGSGVLAIKNNISPLAINSGGGQEDNLRSGTSDVASIVSGAKALEIALKDYVNHYEHIVTLRNHLLNYLNNNKDIYEINSPKEGSPYIVNFSTINKKASVIVEALSNYNIMVSSISACHSKKEKISHTVSMLGKDKLAHNTIRVSFDYSNTLEEIDIFISTLDKIIRGIR